MRYSEIFEGRDAPLYHTMDYDKAIDVFENDFMPALWTHNIPGIGKVDGNSFSRNKNLRFRNHVLLTINQRAITKNKIIPLDGHAIFAYTDYPHFRSIDDNRDRNQHDSRKGYNGIGWGDSRSHDGKITRGQPLSEEFVVGDIKNLHTIITEIYLFENVHYYKIIGNKRISELFETAKIFSEKYNIPLKIQPTVQEKLNDYLDKEQYDDDDE